jgi:hypothetical protein
MHLDSASSTTRICIRGSAAYIKNEIYCVGFLLISINPAGSAFEALEKTEALQAFVSV